MKSQGVVGPQVLSDGVYSNLRQGKAGELVVTEAHGKYYEQNYRGNIFSNSLTAAVALLSGGATGLAPLSLYNPFGSGKNIVLIRTILSLAGLPGTQAAASISYYFLSNTTLSSPTAAPNATVCGFIGAGSTAAAQVYGGGNAAANLKELFPIVSKTGSANPAASNTRIVDEVDGMIILAPGSVLSIQETIADTTSNFTAIVAYIWEEVPI